MVRVGRRWFGAGGARLRSGARAHRLRSVDRSVGRRSGPDHRGRAQPRRRHRHRRPAPRASRPRSHARPSGKPSKPAPLLERGDKGRKVRELQHRLHQLDWFSGSITGVYGKRTVTRGQGLPGEAEDQRDRSSRSRDLGRPGQAGPASRANAELHNTTRRRSRDHEAGLSGRSSAGSSGQAQADRLVLRIGDRHLRPATAASVKGFQAKRQIPVTGEVDQRTLDRLRAMTHTPTSDELHNRIPKPSASGLDSRCLTGRAMCVSKRTNSLVWVVNGQAQLRVDVRFGSYETPTREGSFSVGWKSRNHVSTIYHTPMPYAMFFSGGQAVHYSPDFAARGYNGASHGCVNVRNLTGIRWLFDQVRVGDKVIVYR